MWAGLRFGPLRLPSIRSPRACAQLQGSATPSFGVKDAHDAGVCSAQFHPHDPNLLATGGYDEAIRLWDVRAIHKPIAVMRGCGGGVWRLKWHPVSAEPSRNFLLAACMRGGVRILRNNSDGGLDTPLVFEKHESEALAYGVDWARDEMSLNADRWEPLIASCSFYDCQLRVWRWGGF